MVEHASQVMQILIENFGVASMFGQENIEFFAETTRTSIHIKEKFRYHFQYPPGGDSSPKRSIKMVLFVSVPRGTAQKIPPAKSRHNGGRVL